jgi:hypothetical protein
LIATVEIAAVEIAAAGTSLGGGDTGETLGAVSPSHSAMTAAPDTISIEARGPRLRAAARRSVVLCRAALMFGPALGHGKGVES